MPFQKPTDAKVRSATWFIPLAAIAAIVIAYLAGTYVINNREPELAVNPADQSSATGGSSGESGQNTIQTNPDAKANPGAAPAPAKAPETEPAASDTQPNP